MAGVAAPIVLLSSALNGGSSITIGNAAINATSGLTEGSAAVAFAIASSQISNAATITFSGCAIAVHHHRRSADEPIDGALVAIDRAMLMSMENSVFSGGSAVAVRDSFAFIKSDGSSAGIMYLSYPTVEEGSVLLQGSAFALSSGALTVEANNNNPQSPLLYAMRVEAPQEPTANDFGFAVVNTSIIGAWPSTDADPVGPEADEAFSVVKALSVAAQTSLTLHWLRSSFAFWQQPRAFWDQLTVSQIIAGEAPKVDPMPLADMSTGVCVGNAPFCASSAIFDNAPETDANFLPPLLALTAPPPSCPL